MITITFKKTNDALFYWDNPEHSAKFQNLVSNLETKLGETISLENDEVESKINISAPEEIVREAFSNHEDVISEITSYSMSNGIQIVSPW